MDTNESIKSEFINSAKARLASPLLAFFTTAWIFHNWKLITAIFTLDLPYYEFVGRLESFFNQCDLLWFPLLKAIGVFILYLLVSLGAHFVYSWFKFGLSEIEAKVEKRDLYLSTQYDIYRTAFNAVANSSFLQETFKNSVPDEKAAKMIYSWHKDWQDIQRDRGMMDAVKRMADNKPESSMTNIGEGELADLLHIGLLKKTPSGDYLITYKGAYFYQLSGVKTSSASLISALKRTDENIEKAKEIFSEES